MSTNDEANGKARPAKVQLVMNRLWRESTTPEQTQAMIAAGMQELRDGYRIGFPVLLGACGVCQGVILVAEHDRRTRAIKIDRTPGATHLAILLLFSDQAEWQAQADKLVRLWPEQPGMSGAIVGATGDRTTFHMEEP